jgi:hypothetical protein
LETPWCERTTYPDHPVKKFQYPNRQFLFEMSGMKPRPDDIAITVIMMAMSLSAIRFA